MYGAMCYDCVCVCVCDYVEEGVPVILFIAHLYYMCTRSSHSEVRLISNIVFLCLQYVLVKYATG